MRGHPTRAPGLACVFRGGQAAVGRHGRKPRLGQWSSCCRVHAVLLGMPIFLLLELSRGFPAAMGVVLPTAGALSPACAHTPGGPAKGRPAKSRPVSISAMAPGRLHRVPAEEGVRARCPRGLFNQLHLCWVPRHAIPPNSSSTWATCCRNGDRKGL